ncbi:MAG TPA: hypothetical protein V6C46_05740 [Coleofasciculaceae cyanobacterium]
MDLPELEAALLAAFEECEAFSCPLNQQQQEILRRVLWSILVAHLETVAIQPSSGFSSSTDNPLDQLSSEERLSLLYFIREQEARRLPWKITLLNDWLQGRKSGSVQFIRDRFGIQWLEGIYPHHLTAYNDLEGGEVMHLKVGDRIEISNALWEWVQENGPCSPEWFPCTVIQVNQGVAHTLEARLEASDLNTRCTVRFDTGVEYEIQGMLDWNRANWRWLQE